VQLTGTLAAGGLGLQRASKLTGELLEGREVHVRLSQFESVAAARTAFTAIGVEEVDASNEI